MVLLDKDEARTESFGDKCQSTFKQVQLEIATDGKAVVHSVSVSVFGPFGLGVFDLGVGKLVKDLAFQRGLETVIGSFLPGGCAEEA